MRVVSSSSHASEEVHKCLWMSCILKSVLAGMIVSSLPSFQSMDETFDLPVLYNNEELLLPAQLHQYSYTYKIEVDIEGTSVFFERDDERNWRALVDPSNAESHHHIKTELLQAIASSLQQSFE